MSATRTDCNPTTQEIYHDRYDQNVDKRNNRISFFGRKLAIPALTIVPYLFKNIGLGALKGLELTALATYEFLTKKVEDMVGPEDRSNRLTLNITAGIGIIAGMIVAVPSLLIGGVVGLCRGLYKLPEALRISSRSGFCEALNSPNSFYDINTNKLLIIYAVTILALMFTGFVCVYAYISPLLGIALLLQETPTMIGSVFILASALNEREFSLQR